MGICYTCVKLDTRSSSIIKKDKSNDISNGENYERNIDKLDNSYAKKKDQLIGDENNRNNNRHEINDEHSFKSGSRKQCYIDKKIQEKVNVLKKEANDLPNLNQSNVRGFNQFYTLEEVNSDNFLQSEKSIQFQSRRYLSSKLSNFSSKKEIKKPENK